MPECEVRGWAVVDEDTMEVIDFDEVKARTFMVWDSIAGKRIVPARVILEETDD